MLRVYDTLRRSMVDFLPREEGKVAMYVCGPTVQSEPHVGHARSAVAFDVIRRYLEWSGLEVTYVRNVTDIEDKIIAAAAETGESTEDLADRVFREFTRAYTILGVAPPTYEPRATDHLDDMVALIETLVAVGRAYPADGDVYFAVRSMEGYGKLSGQDPDELRSGYRIEVSESKHDPLDFALWKGVKPGEPYWESPWGPGRPGWHIECSAMAARYLGDGFDIHGGGTDLIFPHHENEIAQSEGAGAAPFARYWLHNGMVNLGGEKMSKSTGHLVGVESAVAAYGARALRLLFVRAHYRSPIEYSESLLVEAAETLDRLDRFLGRVGEPGLPEEAHLLRFREAMDDDFSTPQAVSLLFDLVREGNRIIDEGGDASSIAGSVTEIADVLGLDFDEPAEDRVTPALAAVAAEFGVDGEGSARVMVERLVEMRSEARLVNDFATADRIRHRLAEAGVSLEDGPDGTTWLRR